MSTKGEQLLARYTPCAMITLAVLLIILPEPTGEAILFFVRPLSLVTEAFQAEVSNFAALSIRSLAQLFL
jgi:hypothetical protein